MFLAAPAVGTEMLMDTQGKHREEVLDSLETNKNYRCVNALSWSHDGELLVSSGDDTRLLVWKHDPSFDLASPPRSLDSKPNSINLSCVSAIRTGHTDNVFAAKLLAPGSSIVATCARDRQVRVFDLERAGGTSTTRRTGYGHDEAGNEARLHLLKCHTRQVKRIVTEHSPSTFLTVAGVSSLPKCIYCGIFLLRSLVM